MLVTPERLVVVRAQFVMIQKRLAAYVVTSQVHSGGITEVLTIGLGEGRRGYDQAKRIYIYMYILNSFP